jgi:hypothetical protein
MKYVIKQHKLPFSDEEHDFTLTIHLGKIINDAGHYEAKLQFPAQSYREGLAIYRQFVNEQREYFGESTTRSRISSVRRSSSNQQSIAPWRSF